VFWKAERRLAPSQKDTVQAADFSDPTHIYRKSTSFLSASPVPHCKVFYSGLTWHKMLLLAKKRVLQKILVKT